MGFNYKYDKINRLTEALNFYEYDNQIFYGAYNSNYAYDKNGNISSTFRLEDLTAEKLGINYEGNRRQAVSYYTDDDFANYEDEIYSENCCGQYSNSFNDYSHGNGITANYIYNQNGSLTFDPAKQAHLTYNLLGMPKTVQVPAINGTITYTYNAAGQKTRADYKWHSGRSLDPMENSTPSNYSSTNSTKTTKVHLSKVLLPAMQRTKQCKQKKKNITD